MTFTLGDILRRNADVVPDRVAYVFRDADQRKEWTYAELDDWANRIANALVGLGAQRHDRVALLMRNNPHMPLIMCGAVKAACLAMPLNFRYTPAEVAGLITQGEPIALFVEPECLDIVLSKECRAALGDAPIIVTGPGGDISIDVPADLPTLDSFVSGVDGSAPDVVLREEEPHVVLCTSGTTGTAKGVLQSHVAYYLQTANGGGPMPASTAEDDIQIVPYQMFHSSGWRSAFGVWRARATYVSLRRSTPEEVMSAIAEERATYFGAVPQILREILAWDRRDDYDISRLHTVQTGTSAISSEEMQELADFFGQEKLRVSYGASEIGPVSTNYGEGLTSRPQSVGQPVPQVEVRISHPDGRGCERNEVGEIWIKSAWPMLGYRDDPEQTAAAFADGWYRSGDMGLLDDEAYLFVVGRVREVIRSGGESIFPVEVEEALRTHDAVIDCGAVGIPHPRWGESVAVGVVVSDAEVTAEDLKTFLRGLLAGYKVPTEVVFVSEVPRVEATAKVARPVLRELIENVRGGGA